MRRRVVRTAAPAAALVVALAVALTLASCSDAPAADSSSAAPSSEQPSVTAEVAQLRRDQVLQRVSVAVKNSGPTDVVVDSVRLDADGFRLPGAIRKDSPVASGVVVYLPVPYNVVDCPAEGSPEVGQPQVTLRMHTADDPTVRTVRITAGDGDGLLGRIAARACSVEHVLRDVDLRFADRWRIEQTPDGAVAHGQLRARLVSGPARDVTQVAGAILYGLRPDDGAPSPLASLTPAKPEGSVPVVVFAARCDGHTIGEIKKPYEFLVWVTTPDGEEVAVTPGVGQGTKDELRHVCAF